MKELILQLAAYNTWANGQLLATALTLPEEAQKREIGSSFPGVYKTFLHLLDAENIWWQRIKLQEKIDIPSHTFSGDMLALSNSLQQQDRQWQEWVAAANENALQHEFIYYDLKKERHKQPVYQMLLHLFNHSTYHRGQVVTMLRQLGVVKIPATDFIVWSRKK